MMQKAGLRIINSFRNENSRSFVELCKEAGYPTDLGGYYLRQLLRAGYLDKGDRGEYLLSAKGRQYLASDHQPNTPRVHSMIIATFDDRLVTLKRNQQPFLDRQEWPATAIRAGESKDDATQRLLAERLASATDLEYVGLFRRIDMYQDELFDDKIFLIHKAKLSETPIERVLNGDNICISINELKNLSRPSKSLLDIYEFTSNNQNYIETIYELTYADFEPR